MNSKELPLSVSDLMLNSAKTISVDLPASWLMDQFSPPSPTFSNFDMEAKKRILRGEVEDYTNAGPSNYWWSPISWIDKTEQWIQNWVDTSK